MRLSRSASSTLLGRTLVAPKISDAVRSVTGGATGDVEVYDAIGVQFHNRALYPILAAEGSTVTDTTIPYGDVRRYGAVSGQDSSAAFQKASDTGFTVTGRSGDTYLIQGVTNATTDQVFDFRGVTLQLPNSATTPIMLRLNGANARVIGGTWDLNKANNTPADDTARYGYASVMLAANGCVAERLHVKNSPGLGIKGTNVNNALVAQCYLENGDYHAIYIEALSGDVVGNRIVDNVIDASAILTGGVGLYLIGGFTSNQQKRWNVSRNIVKGPATVTGVVNGTTVRGIDGVYAHNQVTGCVLQHSLDITSGSNISGNRGTDAATGGGTTYGMEINGGANSIVGNRMTGQSYGIACSTATTNYPTLDRNVFANNVIVDASVSGIFVQATASGTTANHLLFQGNVIAWTTAVTSRNGVYLNGECRYAHLAGNDFVGPGSGNAGTRAIYLANVNSNVSIIGNRMAGWERAVALYNISATAYTNITFAANDCSEDTSTTFLSAEGTATIGANCVMMGNFSASGQTNLAQYVDKLNNKFFQCDTNNNNPEGAVTSGIGSIDYMHNVGRVFVKRTGTGNTGWRQLRQNDVANNGDANVTLTVDSSEEQAFTAVLTADRTVTLPTTNVPRGHTFVVCREATATGAFNIDVGGKKTLTAAGQWCDVTYDGSAWKLRRYGSL